MTSPRRRSRTADATAALTGVLLLAAACGGSTPSVPAAQPVPRPVTGQNTTGGGGCEPTVAATICTTVAMTGAVVVEGRAGAVAPQSPAGSPSATCSDIAADTTGGNLGDHLDHVAGHHIAWDTTIGDYHGPGHYTGEALQLTVDADTYVAQDDATVDITIDPRLQTTITFHDLESTGDVPAHESGTISWTCTDPAAG